jgi:MFS family permease
MTLSTAGGRLLSRLGPLTIPGFAFFWSARTISLIGDYAFRVAFITYIISTTHRSATALAVANAVLLVPALVFYLFGGVVGDRVRSRRRVMIVSDVGRCAVAAAIVACISAHAPLAVIIVCAVSISVGDGFFMPAAFACLPEIVPAGRLTSANSAISLSQQAGLIIGPALGGLLIGFGGPAVAFGFDAASFLASAALVAAIRGVAAEPAGGAPAPVQEPAQGVRGLFRDIYGGMQYVRMQQWLLISLAIGTVANAVFAGNLDVTVPLIVSPQGTGGARALGAFYALEGIGAVLGAVIMARIVVNRVGSLMFAMLTGRWQWSVFSAGLFQRFSWRSVTVSGCISSTPSI